MLTQYVAILCLLIALFNFLIVLSIGYFIAKLTKKVTSNFYAFSVKMQKLTTHVTTLEGKLDDFSTLPVVAVPVDVN